MSKSFESKKLMVRMKKVTSLSIIHNKYRFVVVVPLAQQVLRSTGDTLDLWLQFWKVNNDPADSSGLD